MARPLKKGLDYFIHDTDMSSDPKIEALEAAHGNDGYAVFCKLLERLYRNDGRIDMTDQVQRLSIIKRCNVTREKFEAIVADAITFGLFEADAWQDGVLTSERIRRQIGIVESERTKGRGVKMGVFHPENPGFPPGKPQDDEGITPVFHPENPTKQSIAEESKAEQSREGGALLAFALELAREKGARSPAAMAKKLAREPDVVAAFRAQIRDGPRDDSDPEPPECSCGGEIKADRWGGEGRCLECGAWWRYERQAGEWRRETIEEEAF